MKLSRNLTNDYCILNSIPSVLSKSFLCLCLYRKNSNRKKRTMHFDNPVYRKTTEETLTLEPEPKYDHNPGNGVKSGNAYVLVSLSKLDS